uniref:BPTI/Kunitz inhibitor domain-containing protein n=1 Tax=Strongyloides papillosus TaxID=174720 RepID=A0A0N5CC07_STREA
MEAFYLVLNLFFLFTSIFVESYKKRDINHNYTIPSQCYIPLDKGNCNDRYTKFFYSPKKGACLKYTILGCLTNKRGFNSMRECKKNCLPNKGHGKRNSHTGRLIEFPKNLQKTNLTSKKLNTDLDNDICKKCDTFAGECRDNKCYCKEGYQGNGFKCRDIDECSDISNMIDVQCPPNSYCVNTIGSYKCECNPGYGGIAGNCTKAKDVCYQPFDKSLEKQCHDNGQWELRYYYDMDFGVCTQFWYGGCQISHAQNVFIDIQSCHSVCENISLNKIKKDGDDDNLTVTKASILDLCLEEFDERRRDMCSRGEWRERFYFDKNSGRCEQFWFDESCSYEKFKYSSRNIFAHLSTCKRMCELNDAYDTFIPNYQKVNGKKYGKISATFTVSRGENPNHWEKDNIIKPISESPTTENENKIEEITPPLTTTTQKNIVDFKIGNQSYTLINAATITRIADTTKISRLDKGQLYSEKNNLPISITIECLDDFDERLTESCSRQSENVQWNKRWFFDKNSKRCISFWNDGCRSLTSKNNFDTEDDCKWKCEGIHPSPKGRACLDKFDITYLSDCMHGRYYRRWYFNDETKKCEMFYFGGCRSPSKNIFGDARECKDSCETPSKELTEICEEDFDTNYENSCSKEGLFSQYYYFDKNTRTCKMFWYGQCKGESKNIFSSLSNCQWLCERRRESHIPTSCVDKFDKRYMESCGLTPWTKKWYFDHITGDCQDFWHDGCISDSKNFFNDENSCKWQCSEPSSNALNQIENKIIFHIESSYESFRCLEEMAVGSCRDSFPAFYYNKYTHRCEPFAFSGCEGNSNRFLTLQQCESSCSRFNHLTVEEMNCFYPLSVGHGRHETECIRNAGYRYYYNPDEETCKRFWYFGCGSNPNHFLTHSACEMTCSWTRRRSLEVSRPKPVSACFLPLERGNCLHSEEMLSDRWGYVPSAKKCQPFKYSNCGGNENNFGTQYQCENTCGGLIAPNDKKCAFYPDWGSCNQLRYMWYYNMTSGTCDQFLYGGCEGNTNRFSTFELCQITCEVPGEDVCSEKLDRGKWCSPMSNRYYYHAKSGVCKGFHYTGCGNSNNNFKTLEECEEVCVKKTKSKSPIGITKEGSGNETSSSKYKGKKPEEKQKMVRHITLTASNMSYLKSNPQSADYGHCLGFRYNITGDFSKLNAYLCLVEENGSCEMQVLKHTSRNEHCTLLRPWLRGTHLYTWFFMLEKKPWKRSEKHLRPQLKNETIANILLLPVNDCYSAC